MATTGATDRVIRPAEIIRTRYTMTYEPPSLETYGRVQELTSFLDGTYGGPGTPGTPGQL